MLSSLLLGGLLGLATAQFPPEPEGITVLKSKLHENVTISFKEVCAEYLEIAFMLDAVLIVSLEFAKLRRVSDLIRAMYTFPPVSFPTGQEKCRIILSTRKPISKHWRMSNY